MQCVNILTHIVKKIYISGKMCQKLCVELWIKCAKTETYLLKELGINDMLTVAGNTEPNR